MDFGLTLLLFIGFTILGELLRPKPKFDTPEPSSIGDFQLPTAQESRAIPVCWGTCLVKGPNVLWYGGLQVIPILETVKTGLFSKSTVVRGYQYYLTVHLGVCHGLIGDSTTEGLIDANSFQVWFDERIPPQSIAATGATDATPAVRGFGANIELATSRQEKYQLSISGATLFGGDEREGGISGAMDVYTGGLWYSANDHLQAHLGADIPAYRGMVHAVMRNMYVGNSSYIKPVSFLIRRCLSPRLFLEGDTAIDPYAKIGSDANPAYIVLEILTDTVWGCALPAAMIDLDSFYAAAATLKSEGLGMSYMVDNPAEAKGIIGDVLRHVDGVVYTDPATGLITMKLARKDYDVASLPVFDQSNLERCDIKRGSWSETKNAVKVLYIDGLVQQNDPTVLLQSHFDDDDPADISVYDSTPTLAGGAGVVDGQLRLLATSDSLTYNGAQFAEHSQEAFTIECLITIISMSAGSTYRLMTVQGPAGFPRNRVETVATGVNDRKLFFDTEDLGVEGLSSVAVFPTSQVHLAVVLKSGINPERRCYVDGSLITLTAGTGSELNNIDAWEVVFGPPGGNCDIRYDNIRMSLGELYTGASFEPPASLPLPVFNGGSGKFIERPVQWMDLANVQGRGGEIAGEVIRFHGLSNSENANKVAARVGQTLSYPLAAIEAVANRDAWQLRPGSVIKLNWPPQGIVGMVCRVGDIRYGELLRNRIELKAVEDIFALAASAYSQIPETTWVEPVGEVEPAEAERLIELPYHFIEEDHRYVATLAMRESGHDLGYEVWSDRGGSTEFDPELTNTVHAFTPSGVLVDAYAKCTDALDATGFAAETGRDLNILESITAAQRDEGRNLCLIDDEFMAWQTVADNSAGTQATITNVVRGVLDTVPAAHAAGARVWFFSTAFGIADETRYPTDRLVQAKLLPFNGKGIIDIGDAALLDVDLDSRALRPYPPGNVEVNGDPCPVELIEVDAVLTWSHRHRVTQTEDQVIVHQDAGDYVGTPEGDYRVEIYVGGNLEHTHEDFLPSTDPMSVTYTFAQRQIDSTDMDLPVKFVITGVNDDDLESTPREIEFLMSFEPVDATRGLFFYGSTGSNSNVIDYVTVASAGNATDFGDASVTRRSNGALSSATRAVAGGGFTTVNVNVIDYVTVASPGNATDFGDLTQARSDAAGCGSATRGLFCTGITSVVVNTIDYITIASAGNATDFGDATVARRGAGALSSTTRGVITGGDTSGVFTSNSNVMDYVTIASAGNATDFGDLTVARCLNAACSHSTRGVIGAGTLSLSNVIDYITIASAGNATDFGDLSAAKLAPSACASPTRALWGGGFTTVNVNVIDYVEIDTTGNAADFGDLTVARSQGAGCSNGHGGL